MNPYYVNPTVFFKIAEESPNHYLKTKQKKRLNGSLRPLLLKIPAFLQYLQLPRHRNPTTPLRCPVKAVAHYRESI